MYDQQTQRQALSQAKLFEYTEWMHLQALGNIMRWQQWQSNEVAFQGGTALYLTHGSPRHSEDLDFLLHSEVETDAMMRSVCKKLNAAATVQFGGKVALKSGRDGKNPRQYSLKLQIPGMMRKIVLKCEFWGTKAELIEGYGKRLRMALPGMQGMGASQVTPVAVPSADLEEIYLDKMHALVGRPYAKTRDLFDVWWMRHNTELRNLDHAGICDRIANHIDMYPDSVSVEAFPKALLDVGLHRFDRMTDDNLKDDLSRWIPQSLSNLYSPAHVHHMREFLKEEIRTFSAAAAEYNTEAEENKTSKRKPK